jgi:hypothetical protein
MGTKEYDTLVRQHCQPIHFSNKLLKHLAPLWETGVTQWNSILTKTQDVHGKTTYHIQPTPATMAKLPKGRRTSQKLQLQTAINTLRATLLQPALTENKKLPKTPHQKQQQYTTHGTHTSTRTTFLNTPPTPTQH